MVISLAFPGGARPADCGLAQGARVGAIGPDARDASGSAGPLAVAQGAAVPVTPGGPAGEGVAHGALVPDPGAESLFLACGADEV